MEDIPYPETEKLLRVFLDHKEASKRSFVWYARHAEISRRTLQEFSKGRVKLLFETGKRLENWLERNPA